MFEIEIYLHVDTIEQTLIEDLWHKLIGTLFDVLMSKSNLSRQIYLTISWQTIQISDICGHIFIRLGKMISHMIA